LNVKPWFYDQSNLEFKNGKICSYDKNALRLYTSAYAYAYMTPTGLTADQLAITRDANGAAYTQASVASVNRMEIWRNFNEKVQSDTNKQTLLTTGLSTNTDAKRQEQRW
jgi:hypothetical protein